MIYFPTILEYHQKIPNLLHLWEVRSVDVDIVQERLHITGYLTETVDSVRKDEYREFQQQDIQSGWV